MLDVRRWPYMTINIPLSQNDPSIEKGLGAFNPGLNPGEEGVQGWGSLRLALPAEGEGMALPLNQ